LWSYGLSWATFWELSAAPPLPDGSETETVFFSCHTLSPFLLLAPTIDSVFEYPFCFWGWRGALQGGDPKLISLLCSPVQSHSFLLGLGAVMVVRERQYLCFSPFGRDGRGWFCSSFKDGNYFLFFCRVADRAHETCGTTSTLKRVLFWGGGEGAFMPNNI